MKKGILLLLFAALLILLAGCELPFVPSSYTVVTEHTETIRFEPPDAYTVTTEDAFCDAVLELTGGTQETGVIRIPDNFFDGTDDDLNSLLYRVWKTDPLGAYAIDYITADSVKTVGYTEITLHLTYRRTLSEISSITQVRGTYGLQRAIIDALQSYSPYAILEVSGYSDTDCEKVITEYCRENPALIMEIPDVSYSVYPEEAEPSVPRIVEVLYDYTHSSAELQAMKSSVDAVLSAGADYVSYREEESGKYELLFTYLAERFDYAAEPSRTPLYSLLCEGLIDSETVSVAYRLLCEGAGLPCYVVPGYLDGNAYYWNIITVEGVSYHVDLLRDIQAGLHTPTLHTDVEMVSFSWDGELFPKCGPEENTSAEEVLPPVPQEQPVTPTEKPESGEPSGGEETEPTTPENPDDEPGTGDPEPGEGEDPGTEEEPPESGEPGTPENPPETEPGTETEP